MKNYKALILDVDGTLVGHDYTISGKVKNAILSIKNQVLVSLCSGRVYGSIKKFIDELSLDAIQISDGGGEIFDPKSNQAVYQKPIKTIRALELIDVLRANKLKFVVSHNHEYHIDPDFTTEEDLKKYRFSIRAFPDIKKIKEPIITKISILGVGGDNQKQIDELLRNFSQDVHYISASYAKGPLNKFHALDITEKSATKLTALEEYVRQVGINLSDTIVVGDGYNDFPLLLAGGLKIAMGNAVSELKEIADLVVPSVEEDGVATVIEKFLY
jgi:Cof subfamily protein (haloacid dehalogenase superfamily)